MIILQTLIIILALYSPILQIIKTFKTKNVNGLSIKSYFIRSIYMTSLIIFYILNNKGLYMIFLGVALCIMSIIQIILILIYNPNRFFFKIIKNTYLILRNIKIRSLSCFYLSYPEIPDN